MRNLFFDGPENLDHVYNVPPSGLSPKENAII